MARIVRAGEELPEWATLRRFEVVALEPGESRRFGAAPARRRIVVAAGLGQAAGAGFSQVVGEGQFLDMPEGSGETVFTAGRRAVELVVFDGTWSRELGGCGIFRVVDEAEPSDPGDPVDYPKSTRIDSHYHDCDEYWLVLEGRCTAVVDGEHVEMGPGDCLPIGMGYHHDMAAAPEAVKAVYFETGLEGEKRVGHLWEHTHGPARPSGRTFR